VNFFDKVKNVFTMTYDAFKKINEGDTGKVKAKYDKQKAKNATKNSVGDS